MTECPVDTRSGAVRHNHNGGPRIFYIRCYRNSRCSEPVVEALFLVVAIILVGNEFLDVLLQVLQPSIGDSGR